MLNIRMQQTTEVPKLSPKITVIGVGGAGGNAVNNMIASGLEGCEFLVCNTDAQALEQSLSEHKMQLGVNVTGGLGAGAKPEIGEQAAEESLEEVLNYIEGANMAFITAGMGGGTGTGGAPVIARACREHGILTVGVVTKPFHFEGSHRMKMAEAGIEAMQDYVDTLIVIPNQNLFRVANEKTTFAEAFKLADSVLQSGVRGVTDLMVMPGLINLDFADIRSAMQEMGKAMMGTGEAEGERRAIEAAEAAINNPLLDDVSMKGARGVIINVTGGNDMTLFEVDEACNRIRDEVDPNANIIFGSTFEEKLNGSMRVSIVATGIDANEAKKTGTLGGGLKVTAYGGQKPGLTKPAQPATQATEEKASEEPESELFEQDQAQKDTLAARAQNTALRGTRYGQAFIPPKPVIAPPQDSVATAQLSETVQEPAQQSAQPQMQEQPQQQVQQQSFQAAEAPVISAPVSSPMSQKPVVSEQQESLPLQNQEASQTQTSGLNLRPPIPGQSREQQKKKSPSLFERVTGYRRQDEDDNFMAPQQAQPNSAPAEGGQQTGPSQQQLNIDSPSAQRPNREDDLDIPAFLRRQAS